ncbi:unnamed protein product, partial [Effrenium voratum]
SDIAHGMLPWEQHRTWSYRVNLEFFEQGDEEKALGLAISPLCDRATCNIAGGQAFFIGCLCKDRDGASQVISREEEEKE